MGHTAGSSPRGSYFVAPSSVESWTYGTTTKNTFVETTYDSLGRAVQARTVDPTSYADRNRLLSQEWRVDDPNLAGTEHTYAMEWGYDEADRQVSVTYPDDDSGGLGDTVSYTFDTRTGWPASASRSDGFELVRDVTYTDQGAPLGWRQGGVSDPDGVDRAWQYYTDTLRTEFTFGGVSSATDVFSLRYAYTPAGDVVQRNDFRNSSQVECFSYDDLHRLVTAFTTDNIPGTADDCTNGHQVVGQGPYDHSDGYDSINNRTTVDSTTYTFGAGSAGPHALTSVGSTTFGYDQAGRQTSRTGPGLSQTLGWSDTGMVETLTDGPDTTKFYCTADDERILRVDPDGTVTTTLGQWYERTQTATGATETDHYTFAGHRVGFGTDNGATQNLYYTFGDQVSSNSVFYDHTGGGSVTRVW